MHEVRAIIRLKVTGPRFTDASLLIPSHRWIQGGLVNQHFVVYSQPSIEVLIPPCFAVLD